MDFPRRAPPMTCWPKHCTAISTVAASRRHACPWLPMCGTAMRPLADSPGPISSPGRWRSPSLTRVRKPVRRHVPEQLAASRSRRIDADCGCAYFPAPWQRTPMGTLAMTHTLFGVGVAFPVPVAARYLVLRRRGRVSGSVGSPRAGALEHRCRTAGSTMGQGRDWRDSR